MTHDELKAILPLAALDRLDLDEQASLTAHLRDGCPECEPELRELREAAAMLALADDAPATRNVASKIEARLAAATVPIIDRAPSRTVDEARRATRTRRAARIGFAAAAMLALYGVIMTVSRLRIDDAYREQLADLKRRYSTVQAEAQQASAKADALSKVLADHAALQHVLDSPDLQITRLGPLEAAPRASAIVAVSRKSNAAVIEARGLPAAPKDKTYELWWITKESGPVPSGLFRSESGGEIVAKIDPPPAGQRVIVSAVTLEPAGGVAKPSGAMYLKGSP